MTLSLDKNDILFILAINIMIAILNYILRLIKKDHQKALVTSLFIVICPVVGPGYLFASWAIYVLFYKHKEDYLDKHELSLSKDKVNVILKPDMVEALNIVPFEEAFIVSDNISVRRLLLDALKDDRYDAMQPILQAITHSDSEVSHYAASAISDIVDDFMVEEKQQRQNMENHIEQEAVCLKYLDYVYSYLYQKILPVDEQKHYLDIFEKAIMSINNSHSELISSKEYYHLVLLFIDIEAFDRAGYWVDKALEDKRDELDSFKAALKYYHEIDNRIEFLELIQEMKQSDLLLDHEMIELVRFFND